MSLAHGLSERQHGHMDDGRPTEDLVWHRVAEAGEPAEGRVRTVHAGTAAICLTRHEGTVGALDNRCPHQGGPLGEGTIENGLLRCPWHGYDYDPVTGQPPPPFTDAATPVPVREEPDGVYVGVVERLTHAASRITSPATATWHSLERCFN